MIDPEPILSQSRQVESLSVPAVLEQVPLSREHFGHFD